MLIIIDVQDYFLEELKSYKDLVNQTISNIHKKIDLAKINNKIIINLTSETDGGTEETIFNSIYSYPKTRYLSKKYFNGAGIIHEFLKTNNILPKEIDLVGIYLDVCVLETWKGLKLLKYNVNPVDSKCCIKTFNNWRKIKSFPKGFLNGRKEINS